MNKLIYTNILHNSDLVRVMSPIWHNTVLYFKGMYKFGFIEYALSKTIPSFEKLRLPLMHSQAVTRALHGTCSVMNSHKVDVMLLLLLRTSNWLFPGKGQFAEKADEYQVFIGKREASCEIPASFSRSIKRGVLVRSLIGTQKIANPRATTRANNRLTHFL